MIIRNINGKLIQINIYDFTSDIIYYEKIMSVKKEFTKSNLIVNNYSKTTELISNFINIIIIS
jgi:hypothetical protein